MRDDEGGDEEEEEPLNLACRKAQWEGSCWASSLTCA